MTTVKSNIEYKLQDLEIKIESAKSKLESDFMYNFQWGYCEELYMLMGIKRKLTIMLSFIEENPEKAIECLQYNIEYATKNLLDGKFLGSSSSRFHNLAHTYDKEIECDMIKTYKDIMEMIKIDNLDIV